MTNEEAVSEWTLRRNHIEKWLDEYGEEPSIRHYVELIDMAIKALQQTAWIPVGERLPEEDGWYLVTVQGYETVTDVSLYSADGSAWGDVSTKQKVTAWMPLPEPYRGGDNND